MQLVLEFPPPWQLKDGPDGQRLAVLPGPSLPLAIATWSPLVLRPLDGAARLAQASREGLPAAASVRPGKTLDHVTRAGWPFATLGAEVLGDDGRLLECRLCVVFSFLEHAAVVVVRTPSREEHARLESQLLAILASGRPAWQQHASLAEQMDLGPLPSFAADIVPPPLQQAHQLLDAGQPRPALEILEAVVAADPSLSTAHDLIGVARGRLGEHEAAAAAWERALSLAPDRVGARYNLGQVRFLGGDFAAALTAFQRVVDLVPTDFRGLRKVVQCLFALERYDDAHAARAELRRRWLASPDPGARMIHEYVFDQFAGPRFRIHAFETLQPRDPSMYPMFAFRAVDTNEHPLPYAVVVETGEEAKRAGTPYVLGVERRGVLQVLATVGELPDYPELKRWVLATMKDDASAGNFSAQGAVESAEDTSA